MERVKKKRSEKKPLWDHSTAAAQRTATSTSYGAAQVDRMVDLMVTVHDDLPGSTVGRRGGAETCRTARTSARPTSMPSALQATPPLDPPKSYVGRRGCST